MRGKTCSRCGRSKPFSEFDKRGNKKYYQSWCRTCHLEYRKRMRSDPDRTQRRRVSHLRRRYGLSWDDFQSMLDSQGGLCAICNEPFTDRFPAVDHDARTGLVRALLCDRCNRGLGYFRENTSYLTSAIRYLEGFNADSMAV